MKANKRLLPPLLLLLDGKVVKKQKCAADKPQ